MAWEAIRLDTEPTIPELVDALAVVLGVAATDIAVGRHLEKLPTDVAVMAALRTSPGGDFRATLDVVAKDEELGRPLDHAAVAAFCAELGCRALVDDDESDNPYCFLLITADEPVEPVLVDKPSLDDDNLLTIDRPATDDDRRAVPQGPVSQRRPTPPPPASSKG